MSPNQLRILIQELSDGQSDVTQVSLAGFVLGIGAITGEPEPSRMAADLNRITCIEHDSKGRHVIASVSVTERMGAGSVGRQHASDRALGAASRIRSESPSDSSQLGVKVPINNTRLNANRVGSDFENGPKILAQIHH
jgi:hypothetical protein